MNSIDNLRDYVLTAPSICSTTRAILVGYVDGIDKEVEEAREREYRNGREDAGGAAEFADRLCRASERREDVTLWGVDYMAYPLDADGMPIHVGDVMEHAGYVREVAAIGKDCFFAWSDDDGRFHQYSASRFLHRAQEDVEDVLREMLDEHHRWFDGEGERTIGEMVADYAGRLRLKED